MDASQRGFLLNKLADLIDRDAVYLAVSVIDFIPPAFIMFNFVII